MGMTWFRLFILLFVTGCATTQVEIFSEPRAKVYLGDDFLSQNKEIGITPFKMDLKSATEKDFLFLTFENKRFEKQKLVIPKTFGGGRIQVKLTPKEKLSDVEIEERISDRLKEQHDEAFRKLKADYEYSLDRLKNDSNKSVEQVEKKFFEKTNLTYRLVLSFQTALQMEDLNTASRYLNQLRKIDAPESLILILEGNYKYFNREYREAIVSYEKSLEMNPDNVELIAIIQKLKELK